MNEASEREGEAGLRGSLETDVKQELVCLTSLSATSFLETRSASSGARASKLLPHTLPRSACDLLSAGMWRVKTKSAKTKGALSRWWIWKEGFVECLGGALLKT